MTRESIIIKYESVLSRIYRFFFNIQFHFIGKGNKIDWHNTFAKKNRIKIAGGGNLIRFVGGNLTRAQRCNFFIYGSNNKIIIHSHVVLKNVTFYIENDNNIIEIYDDSYINHDVELAASEGTRITIGKGCLFSSHIIVRTLDSHAVLDAQTRLRINRPKDVTIGEHVWVGNGATILKGSNIGKDSIVSIKAVVVGKTYPSQSVIAGNPGVIKKSGVSWNIDRNIPFRSENNRSVYLTIN